MIVKKNKTLILLAGCIAVSTFAMSGCRTAGFNRPNLSALKFWKNPDAVASQKTPPPPARYFDPAPIHDEQIAQAGAGETIELNGKRFDQQLNTSIANNAKSFSEKVNSNVRSLNEQTAKDPVNSLSSAQKQFQTAMQDSATTKHTPTKWNDFNLPADREKSKIQPRLNQSLAGLNKSIYDADGKLVNNTKDVKDSIVNKLNQANNSFAAITKPDKSPVNQFVAPKRDSIAAKVPLANKVTDFAPKPNTLDFKAPALPASTPIANTFSSRVSKPSFMANSDMQPATKPAADGELKLVKAQVADANRQIEELKQQIAMAMNQPKPAATKSPASIPMQIASALPPKSTPVARTAQLKTPRFGNSNYSGANYPKPKPENSLVGTSPTNILRATQQKSQTAQPAATDVNQAFPSTPHGNFAPQGNFGATFAPATSQTNLIPQPASPASFQTGVDGSMTLKASTPSTLQPATVNRRIKSHISQVDIPASILNGSGSYAPGSVNQVGQ